MDDMQELNGLYYEDLEEGMTDVFTKTVSEADISLFAGLSGDTNPIHLNAEYAAQSRFGERIAHGMLSAGFVSAIFGTKLPGPGCVYVNQALRFKAPVHIGDTVVARVTLTKLVPEKKFSEWRTECFVGDKAVIEGEATIWTPSKDQ